MQLWRLRRVCRAFRRWVTEQLQVRHCISLVFPLPFFFKTVPFLATPQSLPPLVVLAGATKKQSCMNNPNKTVHFPAPNFESTLSAWVSRMS